MKRIKLNFETDRASRWFENPSAMLLWRRLCAVALKSSHASDEGPSVFVVTDEDAETFVTKASQLPHWDRNPVIIKKFHGRLSP